MLYYFLGHVQVTLHEPVLRATIDCCAPSSISDNSLVLHVTVRMRSCMTNACA